MKNKYVLWFILVGIICLTFYLQLEFYLSEFGYISVAFVFLLIFDILKVYSEISIFESSSKIVRYLFFSLSLVLIIISTFATFSTRVYFTETENKKISIKRNTLKQANALLKKKREIVEAQINRVKGSIKRKEASIKGYKNKDVKKFQYRILLLGEEIEKLNDKLIPLETKLLTFTEKQKQVITKRTMSEVVSGVTGINASALNVLFCFLQSLILEIGVFIIAFFLGLQTPKKSESKESKLVEAQDSVSNSSLDFSPALSKTEITGRDIRALRSKMNKSQEQLAKELGIHQRKLSRLENGQSKIDSDLKEKILSL